MKSSYYLFFGLSSFFTVVKAQYLSDGWSPAQSFVAASSSTATPDTKTVQGEAEDNAEHSYLTMSNILSMLDLDKLLATGPAVALFSQLGVNITEKMEVATLQSKIWDNRIPMITDDNYYETIVNEPLTESEERDRTWVIVITVSTSKQDTLSKLVDKVFDTAYNTSIVAGDLPDVRWGRIDYFNVTSITTKWSVWNAPYLVVLKDRGQTLRFYRPQSLRLNPDALRKFLERKEWVVTPPWMSSFAPGGTNEYLLDYLALVLSKIYKVATLIPRWMLYFITGGCASLLISFLHKNPRQKPPPRPAVNFRVKSENQKSEDHNSKVLQRQHSSNPNPPTVTKRKKVKGNHGS